MGSILSKPVKWNIIHGATQPWDKVVNYKEAKIREFQGSTPGCPGPNLHPYLHNTHTCTPKGAGHSHGCRGADPPWVYPGVGPSLIHKYIGNNILLLFTIHHEVTTIHREVATSVVIVVRALSASCHCRRCHLCPAVVVIVIVILPWHLP